MITGGASRRAGSTCRISHTGSCDPGIRKHGMAMMERSLGVFNAVGRKRANTIVSEASVAVLTGLGKANVANDSPRTVIGRPGSVLRFQPPGPPAVVLKVRGEAGKKRRLKLRALWPCSFQRSRGCVWAGICCASL